MKVAILGASGMLGHTLVRYLKGHFDIVATLRHRYEPQFLCKGVEVRQFGTNDIDDLPSVVDDCDWIINAIGMIPQKKHLSDQDYSVNELVPRTLGTIGKKVIQIATDCVYSGKQGRYTESKFYDPIDEYGVSKLLGEVDSPSVHHIRCSIIGRELISHHSLLEWLLAQPHGAVVQGFVSHFWNGVTTLQFAKICQGIIENNMPLPQMQHLVPPYAISKYDLLRMAVAAFKREDITIKPVLTSPIDRSLATDNPTLNIELWYLAGYKQPPTIWEMIEEYAKCEL